MGALKAYVHVRLCCSLCHHGRHMHHSLPRRNRQIYGCTLPAGTKMVRGGGVEAERGWRKNEEISVAEAIERNCQTEQRSNATTRNFPLKMKQSKGVYLHWTQGKLKRLNKERSKARLIRQTGRRSFQPSTHQRSRLFRCLVGVKGRQTDCSQ